MNELCFADEEMEAELEQLTKGTIPLKFRFNLGPFGAGSRKVIKIR